MRFPTCSSLALALLSIAAAPTAAQERVYLLGAEAANGDDFGRAVADVEDTDGDGVPDLLVGAPFHGSKGAVFLYSGRTGDLLWSRDGEFAGDLFGWAVDGVGDVNADGSGDLIVGAPGWDNNGVWSANGGKVYLVSGASGFPMTTFSFNSLNAQLGYDVCGLGDITGDGVGDYAYGIPYRDSNGLTDNGYVAVWSGAGGGSFLFSRTGLENGALFGYSVDGVRATGAQATSRWIAGAPRVDGNGVDRGQARLMDGFGNTVSFFAGSTDNEWLGATVAGLGDVNNDGSEDYAFGSPYADILGVGADAGLVKVYSGSSTSFLFSITGRTAGANLGQSLAGVGDVNGDNRDDILVGAPNDDLVTSDGGEARLVSGSGGTLRSWAGGVNDHMGRAVSPAGDLNSDGFADFFFGANDAPFGAGEAYVYLADLSPATIYCTAKVNSQGCTPSIAVQGVASLSIADSLVLSADDVINEKLGILFWGQAINSVPFMGGTLCAQAPLRRTPTQSSGGNPGPDDCSGSYSFHFSQAYMAARSVPAGTRVHAQFWSRDPASPFTVGLTDAAAFDVVP